MATPLITTQQEAPAKPKNPFAQNSQDLIKKNAAMEENMLRQQRVALAQRAEQLRPKYEMPGSQGNPSSMVYGGTASPESIAAEAELAALDARISQAQQRQSGQNADGSAIAPTWTSLVDDQSGQLLDQYKLSELDPTQWQAYQQLRNENLRSAGTPSAWANMQMQKQAAEESGAKDAAAKQAMSGNAQAMAQLQMRGGLGGGANVSLAKDMQRQLLAQRQGVNKQGMLSRLNIGTQDEEMRQKGLSQLTGYEMDVGKANKNVQQYNIGNLLKEAEGQRAWDQDQYKEKMKAWAAEKEAAASSGGGGGGGK